MGVIKAVKLARRIRRFERTQSARLTTKLEALTDPSLLDRMAREEEKEYILTPKGEAEGRRLVYSKRRNTIQ